MPSSIESRSPNEGRRLLAGRSIEHVVVIGANGTMGYGSAALFTQARKHAPRFRFVFIDQEPVLVGFNIAVQGAIRRINIHADRACRRVAGCLG